MREGSAKNWTPITDSVHFFDLSLFFEYLEPLGAFLGHFRTPPVSYGMPKVATWSWVSSYTILDDQQPKKEFLYNDYSF